MQQVVDDLLPGAKVAWDGREAIVTLDGWLVCGAGPGNPTGKAAVAFVASQVQDDASEVLWGRPIPECPGHQHPAVLRETTDGIAWVCPNGGRVVRAYVVDP